MSDVFFGIDLGTTQCSVAYVVDSPRVRSERTVNPALVSFRQDALSAAAAERIPSVIGVDFSDRRRRHPLFGWDFVAMFDRRRRESVAPLRRGHDFFYSVKSDMGTNRVYPFAHSSLGRTPVEITARLLDELARLASEGNPDLDPRRGRTVITVPASFSALARQDTLAAAESAGFVPGQVDLLDEPVAALLDSVNHSSADAFLSDQFQHVLMFDYGGGTCDLALMAVRLKGDGPLGLHLETLAISPYRKLGGDDVDRAIMHNVVWPAICSPEERATLRSAVVSGVNDTLLVPVARRLKEQICGDIRRQLRNDSDWPDLRRIRATAKLEAKFNIPGVTLPHGAYEMTGQEFESVMAPFTEIPDEVENPDDCPQSLMRPIFETVSKADMHVQDLDRVILNGGSSLNPFVRRMLEGAINANERLFSRLQVSEAPSLTCSVARGAALACYWQHARGEQLVAPIMPESLGVIVQGGYAEQIVAAGTELPFPGPDALQEVSGRLFVPPNCGAEILVPFFTGYDGSPPEPRHAGTVKVRVPPGTAPGSGVDIKFRIDTDKTLQWWFSIAGSQAERADEVRDPWNQHVPTIYQRALADHRRKLRELADHGQEFPVADLIDEANLMRRAGDPEGALIALDDISDEHGVSAGLVNIRGLSKDDLGRHDEALEDYRTAAELAPGSAVARGNYGCALEEAGRLDEAIAAIRLALQIDPTLAYLYHRLGTIFRRQGRETDARHELEQAEHHYLVAAEHSPLDPESWWFLAAVRAALGDYDGAEKARSFARDAETFVSLGGARTDVISGTKAMVNDEETD